MTRTRFWRLIAGIAAALTVDASRAAAQTGLEGAIKEISDVAFFYSCWKPTGTVVTGGCPNTRDGYGIEVLYHVGKIGLKLPWKDSIPGWTEPKRWVDTTRALECTGAGCHETPGVCGTIQCKGTINAYVKKGDHHPWVYLSSELALRYSQFSGFSSPDTSFDLRGTVRELPGAAFYLSLTVDDSVFKLMRLPQLRVSLYGGLNSGIIQLSNVQALDHGGPNDTAFTTYSATGSTFQLGYAYGLTLGIDGLLAFVEWGRDVKRFANVQWVGADNRIPKKIPPTLDFSGNSLSVGIQFNVNGK